MTGVHLVKIIFTIFICGTLFACSSYHDPVGGDTNRDPFEGPANGDRGQEDDNLDEEDESDDQDEGSQPRIDFQELSARVFVPYCTSCHSSTGRGWSLDLEQYTNNDQTGLFENFKWDKLVIKDQPKSSRLYQSVIENRMPPARSNVSAEVRQQIAESILMWIEDGAVEFR